MRGRHRGAVVGRVAGAARRGGAGVEGGQDALARTGNVDAGTIVGEAGPRTGRGRGRYCDHIGAVGRHRRGHVGVAVASGDHHGGAAADRAVDRVLVGGRAGAAAAQRHVDDFRRIGIGRHATDGAAGGPHDGIGDVGGIAAALAEHAHRDDLGVERRAGHAGAVVGHRRHGAGDVGAVPAGVGRRDARAALVGAIPVAFVVRVAVAAAAIARHRSVADEVIAGQDVGVEIGMVGDAGVDHGHHDAGAGGLVPGRLHVDRRIGGTEAPLFTEAGVVRGQRRTHDLVDFDVFHIRVGSELAHQQLGFGLVERAIGPDQGRAHGQLADFLQAQRAPLAAGQAGGGTLQRRRQCSGVGHRRTAVAVLHDEALVRRRGLQAAELDVTGQRRRGQQQR